MYTGKQTTTRWKFQKTTHRELRPIAQHLQVRSSAHTVLKSSQWRKLASFELVPGICVSPRTCLLAFLLELLPAVVVRVLRARVRLSVRDGERELEAPRVGVRDGRLEGVGGAVGGDDGLLAGTVLLAGGLGLALALLLLPALLVLLLLLLQLPDPADLFEL